MIRILAYLIVEAAIFLIGLRLATLPGKREEIAWEVKIVLGLFTAFFLKSSLAFVFTVLKLNQPLPYLIVSLVGLISAYQFRPRLLWDDLRDLYKPLSRLGRTETLLVVVAAIFLLPVLASSIRPTQETDSLFVVNPMIDWLKGQATPYTSYLFGYTGYWELTFIPAMGIVGTDQLLWFNSLLAVLGVGLAQFALARQIGLDAPLAFLLSAAGIAIKFYWVDTSGVASYKNDMLQAGGFLLLCTGGLRLLRGKLTPITGLLLAHGLIAASAKYGGMITAIAELMLMAAFSIRVLWKARRSVLIWGGLTAVGVMLSTGWYYIRNWVAYDNPLYPVAIVIPGLVNFPGMMLLEGTAITENLSDPDLWRALSNAFYVGGIALPVSVVAGVTLIGLMGIVALLDRVLRKRPPVFSQFSRPLWFLAAFTSVGLILFARTFWTAGAGYGDYASLFRLNSLRYASAWILLAETLILALLTRTGIDERVLLILPALVLGSRLQHLYEHEISAASNAPYYSMGPVAACIGLCLFLLVTSQYRHWRPALALIGVTLGIMASPVIFERNREHWIPQWEPAWSRFVGAEPSEIGLFYTNSREESLPMTLPIVGRSFQHRVILIAETDLDAGSPPTPPVIVRLGNIYLPPDDDAIIRDVERLEALGYQVDLLDDYVVIMTRGVDES